MRRIEGSCEFHCPVRADEYISRKNTYFLLINESSDIEWIEFLRETSHPMTTTTSPAIDNGHSHTNIVVDESVLMRP